MFTTILFDLDDTLYPKDNGLWGSMLERIESYMHASAGIPLDEVAAIRQRYLESYGTTLRGLMREYDTEPNDYLEFVHDVPIEEAIAPNPELAKMLGRLPQAKHIFTNSSQAHAKRVLEALGVSEYFDGIISIESVNFVSKPDASIYPLALELAGARPANEYLYLDDRAANLMPAKALGVGTVLVGEAAAHPAADHSIASVEKLLTALPQLVE